MAVKCRVLKGGYCEITQYYGGDNNHLGIDIVGKNYSIDTVLAHSDGIVSYIQTGQNNNPGSTGNASYGNFIKINHDGGYITLYAHLDTVDVKVGDKVVKGQVIGVMGNTGNSYGAHTHFEVWKNYARTNPLEYLDKDLINSVISPTSKDEEKNQLKVNVDNLRIRKSPSLTGEILGYATLNGIYNYYETKISDNYTWYKIADNEWLANTDNWCTIYSKKEQDDEIIAKLNLEIEELKSKNNLLEQENKKLKDNLQNYKVFIAPSDGIYYMEFKQNEQLLYEKK